MIQEQSNFGGGLNTLLPGNRLPEATSQLLIDAEVYDNTIRQGESFGGEGGGQVFYYEAGETWVGSSGFSNVTPAVQLIITTVLSSSGDAEYTSPLVIERNGDYTITSGDTITVQGLIKGLFQANSFVEYSQDLYIGRDSYSIRVAANGVNAGAKTLTLESGEVDKIHVGDRLVANDSILPDGGLVTNIISASNQIVIDQTPVASATATLVAVDSTPIRILDGDLNQTYRMGLEVPEPNISFSQIGTNADRASSHTSLWYSTSTGYYPIPYQYGLARFDEATGAESGMSDLTDPSNSASSLAKDANNINRPALVTISDITTGKYALYRTGGTSSVIKKVANLYYSSVTSGTISVSNTTDLNVTINNLPAGKARLNWHSFNGCLYNTVNNDITDYSTISSGSVSFTLSRTAGAAHHVDILVEIVMDDDPFERVFIPIAFAVDTQGSITSGTFLDFVPARALIDIQPILNTDLPPYNMQHVTEVNNFFFGVEGRTLYISRFSDPNNWPLAGYLSFDNDITALGRRGSDLLVFTDFSFYRVFGSTADSMRKVKVPTVEGVPAGLHRCVREIMQGVLYISFNGICFFDGANVTNLSKGILKDFSLPSDTLINNVAGVVDNRYYLLSTDETTQGYVVDMRQGVRIARSNLTAASLHYRGQTNNLYSEAGYLGGGTNQNFTVLTRDFDAGNLQDLKVFRGVQITGESLSGTLELLIDDVVTDIFTLPATQLVARVFRCTDARIGRKATVRVSNGGGRLIGVGVEMDMLAEQTLRRWDAVEFQYTGGPLNVSVLVDGVTKIGPIALTPTLTEDGTLAQLYFPALTEGSVAHLFCEETEADRISRIQYSSEPI